MAEAAGLALGIAALFNSALDCFQLVRVAHDFERDAESCQCKLVLLQLRLSEWGESIGLPHVSHDDSLPFPREKMEKAETVLQHIIGLFDEAEKKSKGHVRRVSESEFSARMREMCGRMRGLSISRKNKSAKASFLTKTKWALTGREAFTRLVDSISGLVNELIAAFPAEHVIRKQEELCDMDAAELLKTDEQANALLEEVVDADDKMLRDALNKAATKAEYQQHHNSASFSGDGNKGLQLGQFSGTMTNAFGR